MKDYSCIIRIKCEDRCAASALAICLNCDVGDYQVTHSRALPEEGMAVRLIAVDDGLVLALCAQHGDRRLVITGVVPHSAAENMSEFISNFRSAELQSVSCTDHIDDFARRRMTHRPLSAVSHNDILSITVLAREQQ